MMSPGVGAATPVGAGDRSPGAAFVNRSLSVFRNAMLWRMIANQSSCISSEAIPVQGNVVSMAVRVTNSSGVIIYAWLQGSYDGETWLDISPSPMYVDNFGWKSESNTGVNYAFVRVLVESETFPSQSLIDGWIAFGSN